MLSVFDRVNFMDVLSLSSLCLYCCSAIFRVDWTVFVFSLSDTIAICAISNNSFFYYAHSSLSALRCDTMLNAHIILVNNVSKHITLVIFYFVA